MKRPVSLFLLALCFSPAVFAQQTKCRQALKERAPGVSPFPPAGKRRGRWENRSQRPPFRQSQKQNTPEESAGRVPQPASYSAYLKAMKLYPVLSKSRQEALFAEFKETGDIRIRNQILSHNQRLVVLMIINRYTWALSPVVEMMDLIQAGNEGLIKAVESYNPKKKNRSFFYLATRFIQGEIRIFLLEQAHIVRIKKGPEHYKVFSNLHKQRERFSAQKKPFNAELAAADLNTKGIRVRPETVEWMNGMLSQERISFNNTALRADGAFHTTAPAEWSDRINGFEEVYDTKGPFLEDTVASERGLEELKEAIRLFLSGRDERERDVFIKRILTAPPVPIYDLGKIHGVSGERIRTIEGGLAGQFRRFSSVAVPDFPEKPVFSLLSRDRYQKYRTIHLLNLWTESVYGMSFYEYVQADRPEPLYPIPLSL